MHALGISTCVLVMQESTKTAPISTKELDEVKEQVMLNTHIASTEQDCRKQIPTWAG